MSDVASVQLPDLTQYSAEDLTDLIHYLRTSKSDNANEFRSGVLNAFQQRMNNHFAEEALDLFLEGDTDLVPISEAEIHDRPAPEWWIEDLVQKGTVAVLAAPGGLGKSFLAIDWTRRIATGTQWNHRAVARGRCLYVIAEGAGAFGVRVRAWDDAHKLTPDPDSITYLEAGVNLSNERSVDRLTELVRSGGYDFIVIDTLSQLGGFDDENGAGKTGPKMALHAAKRIRDAREGASVLVIHHTDAKATKARGSTTIRDNADTLIMAKGTSSGFTLSTFAGDGGKQKDGEPIKLEGFSVVGHAESAIVKFTGAAVKAQSDPRWLAMLTLLNSGEPVKGTELRAVMGDMEDTSQYQAATRYLGDCVKNGILIRSGPTKMPLFQLSAPIV
ncbi:hypothetical protein C5C52_01410 [Rathayibacter sp. AY1E5]|uniref:AAA family ATPase n=1 Tax=Rathayibacter sp. AY1E5 TaxID=2080553 RepID=UPI000CE78495|nr:AAA family ATPase [Rathayibacter sp. AY1E5]PPG84222.1 hypothetical protein C5C52_01410 [Rathayibacter sp. AY1E5]